MVSQMGLVCDCGAFPIRAADARETALSAILELLARRLLLFESVCDGAAARDLWLWGSSIFIFMAFDNKNNLL